MNNDLKSDVDSCEAKESVCRLASKEEILSLLKVARIDSIEALRVFQKCNNMFYYPPEAIGRVIHFVKEDSLKEALTIINNFQDIWTRKNALYDLALHAQIYNLDFALQIANLCDSHYKPMALRWIIEEVLENDCDIETASKIAHSMDGSSSIGAWAAIASFTYDEKAIDAMIKAAKFPQINNNDDNYEVLTSIASSIAYNFPHKAIDLLKDIHTNKPIAIECVALNLADTDFAIELIKKSLIDDGIPWLSSALGSMATKLAKTDMQRALALINEIQDMEEKEETLFWLTKT